MEEASVNLGTDVETRNNILEEITVADNVYEPSYEADPFYANLEDKPYPKMRDITMNRLKNDACRF